MVAYTRQKEAEIADGLVIEAADLNAEFDAILAFCQAPTIGAGAAGTDIALTFDGETNDGVITWMEDEDYFKFSDGINVGVDGTGYDVKFFGDTSGKYWLWDQSADGVVQIGTLTVGVDDAGHDVKFFGDTASAYMLWDASADDLVLAGAAGIDLAGDIDVDGTANLDNTDIDGTLAVDGTTISLDATTSLNIDNSNTSNGITIGTATSGVPISIGHSTSEVTINDNLTVTGTLTLGSGAELAEAELEMLDGITAGTVAASKAVVVDANKDAASFRNVTLTGELDAATLDISGDADIDGTLEADAITVDGTALATYIRDTVGTNMLSSNTESGITVTYDTTNDNIDFAIDAAQTGITSLLATDIKIGEDDQTKIDFETADEIHFYAANVEQVYLGDNIFGPQTDSDVDLGSSSVRWKDAYVDTVTTTGNATVGGDLTVTGDDITMGTNTSGAALIADGTNFNPVVISGDATIATNGALTIADDAVSLAKMAGLARGKIIYGDASGNPAALALGSNGQILKSDGTDISWASAAGTAADDIGTGDGAVTIATSSGNITIDAQAGDSDIIFKGTDNTSDITALTLDMSDAGKAIFNAGISIADGGNIGSASDADAIAIASDGVVTMNQIPVFSAGINVSGGSIAGTLSTAAQANITSLGTLTALTVDDVAINGKVMTMTGSTDDTAVFTVGTNGTLTVETTDTAAAAANIQITADGTAELAGTTVTLDSGADIVLDAAGNNVTFKSAGTSILDFSNSSSDAVITASVQDKDIIFKGDDGGSAVTPLTMDMSAAGKLLLGAGAVGSTLTDTSNSGSITLDFDTYQNFVLTATGNITLANPSTESVGQSGIIVLIQDGTGSRTLSLGTDYETAGGSGLTISTAASAVDVIPYFVKASGSIQLGAPQLAFA